EVPAAPAERVGHDVLDLVGGGRGQPVHQLGLGDPGPGVQVPGGELLARVGVVEPVQCEGDRVLANLREVVRAEVEHEVDVAVDLGRAVAGEPLVVPRGVRTGDVAQPDVRLGVDAHA